MSDRPVLIGCCDSERPLPPAPQLMRLCSSCFSLSQGISLSARMMADPSLCIRVNIISESFDSSLCIRVFASESLHPSLCIRVFASESLHPSLCIRVDASESIHPSQWSRVRISQSSGLKARPSESSGRSSHQTVDRLLRGERSPRLRIRVRKPHLGKLESRPSES